MFIKLIRVFRIIKCKYPASSWLPIVLYIAFITFMLSITFPNGTKNLYQKEIESTTDSSSEQGELNINSDSILKDSFQENTVLSDNADAANILKFAFRK